MTFTLTTSVELHGTLPVLAMGGVVVGLLFGFFAQRSRFCLRAAVIDVWRGRFAARLGVWLLAFGSAVLAVQTLIGLGWLDPSLSRQLSNRGSLSGALLGGALFGVGMIMTRGCASRLLVLSANGNLRALLSGLVFAVTAQAALGGVLSPWRVEIASWWMVDGGSARSLLGRWGAGAEVGIALGLVWLAAGVWFSLRAGNRFWQWVGGLGTGLAVALAWYFTYAVSQASFDPVTVSGLTFSGPSAQWLMRVLHSPAPPFDFDAGMLPAVFVGSALGALLQREFKIEGFHNGLAMLRYISGAMAMGFGSVLAGGCAVGAGMTGGAIFSLTAWLALVGMWLGGGLMDRLLPEPP
ncbi:YeeE/YedE family protein [Melaminivora sp.]